MKRLIPLVLVGLVLGASLANGQECGADKLGWQLAVHAYTFKNFPFPQAVDKTKALGIQYMGVSGSINLDGKLKRTHLMSDDELAAVRKKLEEAGIKLVNWGVVQLPADEAQSRVVFEMAKKLGVDTLIAEPDPKAMDTVEKLCKEYRIKVAIHNHPKPSRYWNPDTVLEALKGRSPLLGVCADTGHWVRSGLDPIECLKKLQGRIICLHFKDLNEKGDGKTKSKAHDVPWDTGVCNVKGMLTELKRQKFRGAFCVEYEHNWDNSSPEIAQSAKYFHQVADELAKE